MAYRWNSMREGRVGSTQMMCDAIYASGLQSRPWALKVGRPVRFAPSLFLFSLFVERFVSGQ
jgi:hypothetical protein